MAAVTPRSYSANILYAKVGTEVHRCMVVSFMTNEALYRQVTRISDEAYQILKGDQDYPDPLYEDESCTFPSSICISDKWELKLGQEGADHRLA
jgi:hypothetical protein